MPDTLLNETRWKWVFYVDYTKKIVWAVMPISRRKFKRDYPKSHHMTKNYYCPGTPESYALGKGYSFIIY